MRHSRQHIIYYLLTAVIGTACNKTDVQQEPVPFTLQVPANFPDAPLFEDNPLTKEGIALGRQLFYDKRLSANNQISCGSCHHPQKAFSDGISLANIGVSGTLLHRHAPALINLAWANNGLFWDGGSTNLESQAFGPLTAHDEMGQNLSALEQELKDDPAYVQQFQLVFKDEIKSAYVVRALAQFQRTLISGNSKYDQYKRKEGVQLNSEELKGLQIVQEKCQSCHAGELFTDNLYHNNGIDNDFSDLSLERIYQGRSRITYDPNDLGKFKTPTLRNCMVTAPYMHDGRFNSIEEVLQHYGHGVKYSATIDEQLMQPEGKYGIELSSDEQAAVVAFLHTLTDNSFINNKKLAAP